MTTSTSAKRSTLVTGAEGALGSSVVDAFVARGERIVCTHFPEAQPQARAGTVWYALDAGDAQNVGEVITRIAVDEGPVGTLVHCVGGFRHGSVDETSDADFEFLLEANFKSAFYLVREVLPAMKESGFGRIVLVSARSSFQPTKGIAAYAGTKAAVNALVAAVADEVKGWDITINAVAPSTIDTPANRRDMPDADPSKWVNRDELARVMVELTTAIGKPIHGAVLPVSGRV